MSIRNSIYVVITDFNGWQQTRTCLQKLAASSYDGFQTIVVDHGTSGETAAGMTEFPTCMRVVGDPDLWWTGATNLGIRRALEQGADYVMLLNNDCYVDDSTLGRLVYHLDGHSNRIVAPVQRDAISNEVLVARAETCFSLGFPTLLLPNMRKFPNSGDALLPTKLIVGGRGVLIPSQTFEQVGLLDEETLPHYGADHDFYLRSREHGVQLYVAAAANVFVDNSRTTTARDPGAMTWSQFRQSLRDPRSHRNLHAIKALFRRHFPVRMLYPIGIFLNVSRYFVTYLVRRAGRLLRPSG